MTGRQRISKEHIIEVSQKAQDGDIILFHETMKNTTEAIEELVPYFAEKGFQIVSSIRAFRCKGYSIMPW